MEGGSKGKRSTRYSGDYQQKFVGLDDVVESEDDAPPRARRGAVPKKGARTKECPGCGAKLGVSIKECSYCDYAFTSRSMLVATTTVEEESANIRSRFAFEPEREEDGSLMIEKLIGRRLRKDKARSHLKSSQFVSLSATEAKYDYEYLVKYKQMSFLHVQWLSAHEIDSMSKNSKQVLTRYLKAVDLAAPNIQEDGEVDPSYVEVEKILDVREEEVFDVQDETRPPDEAETLDTEAADGAMEVDGPAGASSSASSFASYSSALEPAPSGKSLGTYSTTGEPIVLSSTTVFNPNERCRRVLNRICDDPFASSFLEPVDTELYDDYEDTVEQPMCLNDVRESLEKGMYRKHQGYTRFAQDMRLIWANCKSYNLYKSQIWHSAHAMSLLFERIYQAWVVSFSDGSHPMDTLLGCPWDSTCRVCATNEDEERMILCDHCDASFHLDCLRPRLAEVPEGSWYCNRCERWFASHPQAKRLSASAEDEARDNTTTALGRVVVKMRKKKYLVKWRGLSHRECTWEVAKDINDDEKIHEFHRLNDSPPDEPPLTQAELDSELRKDRAKAPFPATRHGEHLNLTSDLDAQVFAQIRAFHFLKWNQAPTDSILAEAGPSTATYTRGGRLSMALPKDVADMLAQMEARRTAPAAASSSSSSSSSSNQRAARDLAPTLVQPFNPVRDSISTEVALTLAAMCSSVARNLALPPHPQRPKLPPPDMPMPSEYEVVLPRAQNPLGFEAAEYGGRVVVLDWGSKMGPMRLSGRAKIGDVLTAINGVDVTFLPYAKIIVLLQATRTPYIYLRFLRTAETLASAGKLLQRRPAGADDVYYHYLENRRWAPRESVTPHAPRSQYFGVFPGEAVDRQEGQWTACFALRPTSQPHYNFATTATTTSGGSGDAGPSVGALLGTLRRLAAQPRRMVELGVFPTELAAAQARDKAMREGAAQNAWPDLHTDASQHNFEADGATPTAQAAVLARVVRRERAESEANAQRRAQMHAELATDAPAAPSRRHDDDDDDFHSLDSEDSDSDLGGEMDEEEEDEADSDDEWGEDEHGEWRPSKDISANKRPDGPTARLLRAVTESNYPPIRSDWNNYVIDCCTAKQLGQELRPRIFAATRREGVPVDQLDLASGEVVRRWKSANAAATTLQITQYLISSCCTGRAESAGGFRFRYSADAGHEASYGAQALEIGDDGMAVDDELDEAGSKTQAEDSWKLKLYKKSKDYRSGGTLRDYQLEGLNWLLRCWYQKRSSILADEMGLGKTVQVVSFLDHLFEAEAIRGPFLVCVPLSTIEHWKREFEGWSHMVANVYHDTGGGRDMRDIIREFEWYYKGRSRRLLKFHVLITTYDDLIRDYEELAEVAWRVVVVDEAHRLRNTSSRLLECMRAVVSRGLSAYGYQHRILMTGTPLQNNTDELWSLLNFIEPTRFPDFDKFKKAYGVVKTQEQVEGLQRRLAPHLLRRVKEDVAKDIPPKEETVIDVELTTTQKQYYRAIFEHNHGFLMQTVKGAMPKLMNIQMELRKVCNHPWLVGGVEETEMDKVEHELSGPTRAAIAGLTTGAGHRRKVKSPAQMEYTDRRMKAFVPTSGKMVLLDKLLPKLKREGHKVLIFSQMVKMLDLIEEYCEWREYSVERLDGRVSGNDRQKGIDRFNKNADSFVFLLSTRAGGVGINLTAADTVIIFDSDWNPQNDVQKKSVTIYRLITRRSFEAEMFDRASKKLGLEQAILGTRQFNADDFDAGEAAKVKVDAKEMEQLLREGAYAVFMDEDDTDLREFCEQDIDKILESRAHTLVTEDAKGGETWLNSKKKGNKTKKSLFTGAESLEFADLDVNDPDFWAKVLPDLVTPDSMWARLQAFEEDGEAAGAKKFFKDLHQMMEGMTDLVRRGQMPDRERGICINILLGITLRHGAFEARERSQAQEWLSVIEGTRNRRGRQEVYDLSKMADEERGRSDAASFKRRPKTNHRKKVHSSAVFDEDDEHEDEEDDDEDFEATSDHDGEAFMRPTKGVRGKGKKNKKAEGQAPLPKQRKKRASKRLDGDLDDDEPKAKKSKATKQRSKVPKREGGSSAPHDARRSRGEPSAPRVTITIRRNAEADREGREGREGRDSRENLRLAILRGRGGEEEDEEEPMEEEVEEEEEEDPYSANQGADTWM